MLRKVVLIVLGSLLLGSVAQAKMFSFSKCKMGIGGGGVFGGSTSPACIGTDGKKYEVTFFGFGVVSKLTYEKMFLYCRFNNKDLKKLSASGLEMGGGGIGGGYIVSGGVAMFKKGTSFCSLLSGGVGMGIDIKGGRLLLKPL